MNIVCDIFSPVMKVIKSVNLLLLSLGIIFILSSKAKADTLLTFSIYDNQWKMKIVGDDALSKRENIIDEVGFTKWDHTKADCDSPTLQMLNLTSIANIANRIEGGQVGSLPAEEVTAGELDDKGKLIGDIVEVAGGQGAVVSENNCYAVVATVFHNLAEHTTRNGKRVPMTRSMPLADINHRHFEPIKRFTSNSRIGVVERIINVPSNEDSILDTSEEATLVVIKKPGCDALSDAEKFADAHHHQIFDFNSGLNYAKDMMDDRSGEAGIYSLCRYQGKIQKQRGGISKIQISDNQSNRGKQDLAVVNTKVQTGSSGCPLVYRDSKGTDHLVGVTSTTAGKKTSVMVSGGYEIDQANRNVSALFTKDIAKALQNLRQDARYFR